MSRAPTASTLSPGRATAEIVEAIEAAREAREPLRVAGNGSWLDAGPPVSAPRTVRLERCAGIIEYVPGDLVLTALAGTTLREIAAATAVNDQWLPLDPFGSPEGTIGATVATASAGPLAHANGGPRDLVLGVECVTGAGEIVRGGGRVTKNVAGFDLTRLLVGSWGTLGVITEVSVRLRARPAAEVTLAMPMPPAPAGLHDRLAWVRRAPLQALAVELVDGGLARQLDLDDGPVLLLRLGGNEDSVAAQRATLARGGAIAEVAAEVWDRLRVVEAPGAWVWRMSDLPSRIADTWSHAESVVTSAGGGGMHASVGRGIVRCICTPELEAGIAALTAATFGGTIIHERLPRDLWPRFSRPAASDAVSMRIREAFDPDAILNPGILGEGAR